MPRSGRAGGEDPSQGLLFPERISGVICGIDEAGRGPLAGPVSAAAVILPEGFPVGLLDDSKALSERGRERAFEAITTMASWANDWAWPWEIDEYNILGATMLAMRRAFLALGMTPDITVIDGTRLPDIPGARLALVKADATVPAVMAASIVAKVSRDRLMERYDWLYPEYGYARHKGYPTREHRAVCRLLGPSPIQRFSFNYSKE
jgi:ribonuclease HII